MIGTCCNSAGLQRYSRALRSAAWQRRMMDATGTVGLESPHRVLSIKTSISPFLSVLRLNILSEDIKLTAKNTTISSQSNLPYDPPYGNWLL